MHDRLKSIKAIAKAIKLRLPFEPANDNMHDLIDAIVSLCDEPVQSRDEIMTDVLPKKVEKAENKFGGGIKWSVGAKDVFSSNETTRVKAYLINESWLVVGIPKRQPFHEQVFWCANKGASKIKIEHDGIESEILVSQVEKK